MTQDPRSNDARNVASTAARHAADAADIQREGGSPSASAASAGDRTPDLPEGIEEAGSCAVPSSATDAQRHADAALADPAFLRELAEAVGPGHVHEHEPLSEHTSFRIGGPARVLVEPASASELAAVMRAVHARGVRSIVIGSGSNLLFADEGFAGVVVKVGPRMSDFSTAGSHVRAGAGLSMRRCAKACAALGLSGLEFASGIPGHLGGGVFMNAGAYGGQLSDVLESATVVTPEGHVVEHSFSPEDFGYRQSPFTSAPGAIVEVGLRLTPDKPSACFERIAELDERRSSKQPLDLPSAGSAFKRPEGAYASALIDEAGLKGLTVGGAQVSERHAGFIVNVGGASAQDVTELIDEIKRVVRERSGIELEPELRVIARTDDSEEA